MTAIQTPYGWLDSIEPRLFDKTKVPYADCPEAFSMEELAGRLGNLFQIPGGKLTLGAPQKIEETAAFLETQALSFGYQIGLLADPLYWVIDRTEAQRLIATLLKEKQQQLPDIDPDLTNAFMRYLSLESLLHLRALGFQEDLLIQSLGPCLPSFQEKPYLRFPLSWELRGTLLSSMLLLPESLVEAWNHYFEKKHHAEPLPEAQAERISLLIHFDVGTITLTSGDWEKTQVGDFLLMDHCTLIPGKDKGRIRLTASSIPLFRAMVKEGAIKLLDYSLYQEVEPPMSKKFSPDELSGGSQDAFHEDEEEIEDEELEEESEFEDEETGEEFEETQEEGDEEELEEEEDAEFSSSELENSAAQHAELEPEKELISIENVPFTLTVEVGRVQMSLAKLRQLEPGQTLDLDIHPEDGVDLVVEGQTIGRGELLRLGENIGVRVTELG